MAQYQLPQDRFYALLDSIEEQDGFRLPKVCSPISLPMLHKGPGKPPTTHGCYKGYMVSIPYEGIEQKEGLPKQHDGAAIVCAEGDAVELWPRFQ